MKPAPGQYWRQTIEPEYKGDRPKGTLVLVTAVDEEGVHFASGDRCSSWLEEPDDSEKFEDAYEYAPDGQEQQAKRLTEVMHELETMEPVIPKALPMAQDGFAVEETALTVTGSLKPEQARRAVATARNTALKFKKKMLEKQEELKMLLSEQQHALQAKVDKLDAMVKIASEAIWTIELYLGRHETIKQLRGGKAAPKDEKIVVRQLVLNMDEECAVAARHGGIDSHEVHEFDKWVKQPKHLQQVLPEVKGIVAFHVRGKAKRQGDRDAVRETYFLIRNGERLFRIQTNLVVGETLFPTDKEFQDFFFAFRHDWDTGEELKEPLRPGSRRYMHAMKKSDKRKRHYLRILLFMQGLIDRTKVFKPLPSPQVNLCDPKQHEEYLRFLRDAEMILTDGRPSFHDWMRDINSRMEIGMRLIGEFRSYEVSGHSDLEYRSHPKGLMPDSHALYTVERREGDSFVVLFAYDVYGHTSKKRASFRVHKSDSFVINFDLVTEADIHFYLSNRLDRGDYTKMFPLLKCARRLRQRETKEEAPFRKLLAGEIAKAHGVKIEQAAARVDDLIRWWKYKNKTHRALKSDDAKALRMIVKEFRLERERAGDLREQAELVDPIVKALRKAVKDAIYVGHRKGKEYVTIAPMNKENLFVCEQVWRLSKKTGLEEITSREWALLDKRCERWQKLWATGRWPKIKIGVRRENVLTDPEIKAAIKWAFAGACQSEREDLDNRWASHRDKYKNKKTFRFLPLAATWNREKYRVVVYYSPFRATLPQKKRLLTSGSKAPPIYYREVGWTRKQDRLVFKGGYGHEIDCTLKLPPWKMTKNQFHHEADEHTVVVKLFSANIKVLEEEGLAYDHIRPERARLKRIVNRARHEVECRMGEDLIEAEHKQFREDLKDETMWEDHLKEKKIDVPNMYGLQDPLSAVVETGMKLGSKTLAAVLKKAKASKKPLKLEADEKLPKGFKFSKGVDLDPPKDDDGGTAQVPDEIDEEYWDEED